MENTVKSDIVARVRAGCFVMRDDHVLLMQRNTKERGEYWVVPGGSVESREYIEDAATREILEETNVACELLWELYESNNPDSGRIAHYFVARWLSGEPTLGPGPESKRASEDNVYTPKWVKIDEVAHLPLFPTIIRMRLAQDLRAGMLEQPFKLVEND
jgi:8-oxo-dGTP diphosphatase